MGQAAGSAFSRVCRRSCRASAERSRCRRRPRRSAVLSSMLALSRATRPVLRRYPEARKARPRSAAASMSLSATCACVHVPVAEQARHHRQRSALHDRVAGERMPQIVQTNVFQTGPLPRFVPEREAFTDRSRRTLTERRTDSPFAADVRRRRGPARSGRPFSAPSCRPPG